MFTVNVNLFIENTVVLYKDKHYTLNSNLNNFANFKNIDRWSLNNLHQLMFLDNKTFHADYIMKSSYLLFKYLSRMNLVKRFTN